MACDRSKLGALLGLHAPILGEVGWLHHFPSSASVFQGHGFGQLERQPPPVQTLVFQWKPLQPEVLPLCTSPSAYCRASQTPPAPQLPKVWVSYFSWRTTMNWPCVFIPSEEGLVYNNRQISTSILLSKGRMNEQQPIQIKSTHCFLRPNSRWRQEICSLKYLTPVILSSSSFAF